MTEVVDQLNKIERDINTVVENAKTIDNEVKAKLDEMSAKMSELEKLKTLEDANKAAEAKLAAMEKEFHDMQKKAYRVPVSGSSLVTPEMKEFDRMLRSHEFKFMSTFNDPAGGYLVNPEFYNGIIEKIIEISPVRRYAQNVNISTNVLEMPSLDTDMIVYNVNEAAEITQTDQALGRLSIPVHDYAARARVTRQLLQDNAYDLIGMLNRRAIELFAQKEGQDFLNGDGNGKPRGLLQKPGILNVNSGHASTIPSPDALFDMIALMKYESPIFIMNRATLVATRKLKDGMGGYMIQGGVNGQLQFRNGQEAGTILGIPVVLMEGMPNIGAGNKPIVLTDLRRAYMIVDRAGMEIIRDDYTRAKTLEVEYTMHRRVGGDVILPEAVIGLTVSV